MTPPTLKAGILMSKNNINSKNIRPVTGQAMAGAFTFIEVIIALAIVSISLLALLRLHLTSIRLTDTAQTISQAVLLADEKIAEALAAGYPKQGANSGIVEKNDSKLHWQTEVADLQSPQLNEANVSGLRKISVDVRWKQGTGWRHLRTSTYVADRKLNEK